MVEKTIDKLPCSAYNIKAFRQRDAAMARWSSGQDGGLSRRKQEFDSPTGHQICTFSSVGRAAVKLYDH